MQLQKLKNTPYSKQNNQRTRSNVALPVGLAWGKRVD